jgi:4-diphosphocytidyl-2-C-methyl-D-erythritol kinase
MVVFPNAKINLGLAITGKREDGYHDLETVFFPAPITDVLELITGYPSESTHPENNFPGLHFSSSGLAIDGRPESNLCVKAYKLLASDFPEIGAVSMHLHKNIPMGAGLGGGSADGSFTLKLLDEHYQLGLSTQQLIDYAARLGSDCPFFILNKPCLASSRGEVMEEISLDLGGYDLILVSPRIHVNTGWAFSQLQLSQKTYTSGTIRDLIAEKPEHWKGRLVNDFEEPVFKRHPELAEIKSALYDAGAIYASMSGSGSTVFALVSPDFVPPSFHSAYTIHRAPITV